MHSDLRKMDKVLLFLTIFMFALGLLMIFSASSVKASLTGSPYYYFVKQAITLGACVIVSLIIIKIPLKSYNKLAIFLILGIIGTLIAVYLYGAVINRARSWIPLGFYNFQPSEFAKTAIILYMAVYYNKHKDSKKLLVLFIPVIMAAVIAGLTFIQPDFGTTFIIVVLTAALFFSVPFDKGVKRSILHFIALAIGIAVIFLVVTGKPLLSSEQSQRLDYKNPCSKYLTGGTGYQVCNGYIAINNGGLWGVGLGNSTQKYLYLPAADTDFIFAIILEELGLVAGVGILLVFILIIILILRIAFRSHNLAGSMIAYGTAIYMFLHIAINLTGLLGIGPLTGVPLPFLSYGGSYALNLSILLSLVQRVEIENKKNQQERSLREGRI